MASDVLFRSLSPLFWFLRLTGGTPFHHSASSAGILAFQWRHPQTLWFALVTLLHLSFISAQIFGGYFSFGGNKKETEKIDSQKELIINSTVRFKNIMSQTRFLVDTFFLSKLVHFNLPSFQAFFQHLGTVDRCVIMPFTVADRARKIIIVGILVNLFWVAPYFLP
jgi:hypothetical protein